jgi:hypothetical protein
MHLVSFIDAGDDGEICLNNVTDGVKQSIQLKHPSESKLVPETALLDDIIYNLKCHEVLNTSPDVMKK